MDNLIKLLAILGLAIFAMVFILGRFGKPIDEEKQASIGRWILPLIALLLVAQLLAQMFR